MAVVRAGTGPIDLLAPGYFYDATPDRVFSASTSTIVLQAPSGATQTYRGAFQYDASGNLVGGTLTRFTESDWNGLSIDVQALQIPVTTYLSFGASGNYRGLVEFGLRGDDQILGGAAADRLGGFAGNDRLDGGGGNDIVQGGSGRDTLVGGVGDDQLGGSTDADLLAGGFGRDMLWGGPGADVFAFGSAAETLAGAHDRIVDFAREDTIDLRAIDARPGWAGDQAFAFIGTLTGMGQVALVGAANGTWLVGSTDADSAAEFAVLVQGTRPIASDLLL